MTLPPPDMTMPTIDLSPTAGHYYRAATVLRLLDAERERCARECEKLGYGLAEDEVGAHDCAAAIRARGETP